MSGRLRRPWVLALALSTALAGAYLIAAPPSGDLATATYRANLFARYGFTLWDGGWYGGHYLPGYSLLSPALGALLGERLLLPPSAVAAASLFGLLVERAFDAAGARVAAVSFALGIGVELLSGRVAYDLGLAIGLLALVALQRGHAVAATGLAALTSMASPVAGAFLALAGLAAALAGLAAALAERPRRARGCVRAYARGGAAMTVGALTPVALLAVAFPEGGYEPFAPSVFWPGLAGVVAIALALPWVASAGVASAGVAGTEVANAEVANAEAANTEAGAVAPGGLRPGAARILLWGAWLYAAALVGSYALRTPVGSNAARLGELLGAPLVAGALWERRRLALALLAPVLLYWQLETPINDVSELIGDPSVNASYYAPLVAELRTLAHGSPLRVEIPQTGAHWESVYIPQPGLVVLARGWERQLDTRYGALFYGPRLTAAAYRAWLAENAVSYVALPDVRLDFSGEAEGRLIAHGLPYLREVWRAVHWRLFAVRDATPLAQPPAILAGLGADSFALRAPRPGDFEVRVRFTPYWALLSRAGCVGEAPGGWTLVRAPDAGVIRVGIDFSLTRVFAHGPRCRT